MLQSIDRQWWRSGSIILTGFLIFITVPLLLFHSRPFEKVQSWLQDHVKPQPAVPVSLTDFYNWDTKSAFKPVDYDEANHASVSELCRSFPTHLLEDIQPVLKTGYAVLHDRLPQQLESVSACLNNLLIFSDFDEDFEGHEVIDVVADIPAHMRTGKSADARVLRQLATYDTLHAFAANDSLAALNATDLKGHKTDKYKFLPSISRAWKMRPERRWYVFYEDDTYFLWDNVFRFLEQFDPDLPYYFGAPAPGCRPSEDIKVMFAYGGAGYFLSREAMRKLVKDDWDRRTGVYLGPKLQEKWWTETMRDPNGDSILGCVLWKNDVTLSGMLPMFQGGPPRYVPFSENFWCQPAISMHKLSEEEIHGLWRWEWQHRQINRPLLFRDIATSYFDFANLTSRENWDNTHRQSSRRPPRHSDYYSRDPNESFEACKLACEALPKCLQWTYHLRTCKIDNILRYGTHRDPELGRIGEDLTEKESKMDWSPDELRFRAGWSQVKVRRWIDARPCEMVEWPRPDTIHT